MKHSTNAGPESTLAVLIEILQRSTEFALIVTDLDGKVLRWNEGARCLYGYDPEEVIGKAKPEILHTQEDVAAGLPATIQEQASQRGKWEGILMRVRKNGQRFHVRTTLAALFDAAGQHHRYLLISENVTPENPSAQAQEKFRRLLESTPDAMPIVNEDGRIPIINSQTERLFGYRGEDLIGQPTKILAPGHLGAGQPAHRMDYSAESRVRAVGEGREAFLNRCGSRFALRSWLPTGRVRAGITA
jgi:PAS domain S-box-containing protein